MRAHGRAAGGGAGVALGGSGAGAQRWIYDESGFTARMAKLADAADLKSSQIMDKHIKINNM
jgi:hypothetical protein